MRPALAVTVLLAIASPSLRGEPPPSPRTEPVLTPGTPLEGTLAASTPHAFSLSLSRGSFMSLTAEQVGADVRIKVTSPSGAPLADQNLLEYRFGREVVFLTADESGPYRIEVQGGRPARGRYRLRADVAPALSVADRARIEARAALMEAKRLEREQKAESSRAAIARYESARSLWEAAGEADLVLSTLIEIGRVQVAMSAFTDAAATLGQALAAAETRGAHHWIGRAQQLLGDVAFGRDDFPEALLRYEASLAKARQIADEMGRADLTTKVGVARFNLGESRKGVELVKEAVGLWRELGDERGELTALGNLGACHLRLSEMQEALDIFTRIVPLRRKEGSKRGEATALTNVAVAYGRLGERAMALEAFEQALSLFREIGERRHPVVILTNMGVLHRELGSHDKASELYEQALAAARQVGERGLAASVLRHRASHRVDHGDVEGAAADAEEAARTFAESQDRWLRAGVLKVLVRVRNRQGQPEAARSSGQEAFELYRGLGDREGEAGALYELARLALDGGDLLEARRQTEAALERIEFLRRTVRSTALRAAYTATLQEYYELAIEILMRLHEKQPGAGFDAEAFRAAEQARGRGLLELLVESKAAVQEGVAPALIERERELQDALSFKLDQQVRLLSGSPKPGQAEALADEIDALTAEHEDVSSRIRAQSPKYAALIQPEPASVAQIQGQLLDEGTVLLEYALGSPRSHVWAVTVRSLTAATLPPREEIERPARRAHELLSRRSLGVHERRELEDLLVRLSGTLLDPVTEVRQARRIVVVADGALQYLPFAALPDPADTGRPLIVGHELVAAPSASLLALLREEVGARPKAPKMVAVLADPVFDARDARLIGPRAGEPSPASTDRDLARVLRETGLADGLPRLPFTRREARAILGMVSPARRREALDFEANRATATDADLGSYRYLHFATHGFLNSARPELSGLVLSLVDRQGGSQRGFLAAPDVFGLRLGADLVVLSGCRTALGREVRGEGLVGLPRAFMYAGTPRVAASLWQVDDAATAELMKRFYRGMLIQGLAPAAALRAAQVSMSRSRRFADPYYWAAFQLQGEWN